MNFDLGDMLSTAWDIGKDFLFGSPGQPTGTGAPVGPGMGQPTSGILGSGGNMSGFIKQGAQQFLKSQGMGPGQDREGQFFTPTEFRQNRTIKELTRGQSVGQVQLSDIQRTLYSMPEVRRAARMMQASNNSHVANLRAATGVEQTIRQGRKTLATKAPELREIDV